MIRKIHTLLSLLFFTCITHAQKIDEKSFFRYTTGNGLSHNSITGIAQDSAGFMWIAGAAGLNRFNGSGFKQYHSSDDKNAPASEDMNGMVWLDKHRLAVYNVGLYIFDTKNYTSRNIFVPYHDLNYQFKYNMIMKVLSDKAGNIFVLTRSGFYQFNKDYKLTARFDYYPEELVPYRHFVFGKNMFWYDDDRLLILGIDGMYLYKISSKKLNKLSSRSELVIKPFLQDPKAFYHFFQTEKGKFFIIKNDSDSMFTVDVARKSAVASRMPFKSTFDIFHYRSQLFSGERGEYYVTAQNAGFYKVTIATNGVAQLAPTLQFSAFFCTSVLSDRNKQLWIGTNRGLLKQDAGSGKVDIMRLSTSVLDSFPMHRFDDVIVTDQKVYAGARAGGGLFVIDKKTFKQEKQIAVTDHTGGKTPLNALYKLSNDELLVATGGPVYIFNTHTQKLKPFTPPEWHQGIDWFENIHRSVDNKLWMGSGSFYSYDLTTTRYEIIRNTPLETKPYKITSDKTGRIWIASHGAAAYNQRTKQFDILLDSFPYIKMPDKQINALATDSSNRLWLNSANNGLACFDPATKKFLHFTTKDGLPDNNISSLICLDDKLWIACFSGLACLDLKTYKITGFGREDGLPRLPIALGAQFYYDLPDSMLYIGYTSAVVRFHPKDLLRSKTAPQAFVESIQFKDQTIPFPSNETKFSYDQNNLRITIGTINFTDRNTQHFAYRFTSEDSSSWQNLGNQSSFLLSSLPPGVHAIEMKVFSPDNRWPEQRLKLQVIIRPPFWKQTWFVLLACAAVILSLFKWMRWRTDTVRKKEEEKTKMEKLKADEYKNRLELEHITNYFSSSLSGKHTEDDVLWDVAHNVIGKMNYEDCIIYMWNADKTKLIQKAAYGPKGKPETIVSQQFEVLPGQGIVGHVAETRQPVLIGDTRTDQRYRVDDQFRLSEVCVPIIHNNELLGVIDSEHSELNYFRERDVNILSTIATLIANKLKQIESERSLHSKRQELANINEQLAEARLSALQSQMNPHFVFNALNSIKRMILEAENEKASRYLSKFAQMIRMTLEHSKNIFITLEENITYLRSYIEMEQLRFDESFSYTIDADENIDLSETPIPSMMLQPIVENAVWHGLMLKKGEKRLKISFKENDGKIICTIEDNGIGIRKAEELKKKQRELHNSVGLENLKKRFHIMNEKYNMGFSMKVTDLSDLNKEWSGTRVVLQFNIINI